LINSAQAVRFTIYLDLILALVAAFWFDETALMRPAKLAIAGVIVISIIPNMLDQTLWACSLETPEFFTTGQFRDYLRPGENVLLLPFSAKGQSMTWQALSGMYFASADGGGRLLARLPHDRFSNPSNTESTFPKKISNSSPSWRPIA
jgi:hypothetical protein